MPQGKAVDFSFAKESIAQLVAAGITAVGRYVGPPAWGKTITQAEYDALTAAGIAVWLIFEDRTNDASGGFQAGVANARVAEAWIPSGYPLGEGIYFAVDESVSGASLAAAVEYIHGASAVLGPARTGDYGEGALLEATEAAGYATHHMQSASTSYPGNATTSPVTDIQQGGPGPLPGTDTDTVLKPLVPPGPPPAPPAPPVPAPTTQEEPSMITADPTSGAPVATDANGNLYVDPRFPGALPAVPTLSAHPAWAAGEAESAGANPCVGITFWRDPTGEWGICFVTQPTSGTGSFGPYDLYHFARSGLAA